MNDLVKQAIELKEQSDLILNSIIFTNNEIDNLPDLNDDTIDLESVFNRASTLLGKLKVDYLEWKKIETEYEVLRLKVNSYYNKELLLAWEPLPDMDFGFDE